MGKKSEKMTPESAIEPGQRRQVLEREITITHNGRVYIVRPNQAFRVHNGYAGLAEINSKGEIVEWVFGASIKGKNFETAITMLLLAAKNLLPEGIAGIFALAVQQELEE